VRPRYTHPKVTLTRTRHEPHVNSPRPTRINNDTTTLDVPTSKQSNTLKTKATMNVGMPKRQRKNYGVKQHLRDNESEDKRKMTKAELEDWSTCTKSPQTVETFLREKSEDDDEDDPLLEDF